VENWYVLYTKARKEKLVASQLQSLGIKAYCPMITTTRQWSDRKKKVSIPLISSCVFIQTKEADRDQVFQVPGTVRYLFWLNKPAIVRNSEIETLETWLSGENTTASVENILPGDTFKIKDGAFKDKEGIVNQVDKNRIQLLLVELGMKITIIREPSNSL